jgi:hypothetical protein
MLEQVEEAFILTTKGDLVQCSYDLGRIVLHDQAVFRMRVTRSYPMSARPWTDRATQRTDRATQWTDRAARGTDRVTPI